MTGMATPPNDESLELFRLLGDMQWHNYQEIKAAIARKVPPGRALRKYQEDIESRRRTLNDPSYDVPHGDDLRIELGAKRCAQSAISSWANKAIFIEGKGDEKRMRIKEGFTSRGIPGFEPKPVSERQDPHFKDRGYAEVPPEDSEPSESDLEGVPVPEQPRNYLADFGVPSLGGEEVGPIYTSKVAKPDPVEQEPVIEIPTVELIEDPMQAPEVEQTPDAHAESAYAWPPISVTPVVPCPDCGLAVSDWATHEDWHGQFVKRAEQAEMALLNESQLVDLLRDVMGQQLDQFQAGMQGYLETQFAHVNGTLLQILTGMQRSKQVENWRTGQR